MTLAIFCSFSQELDLMNPASFRDLSKPMGAQTPDRLKQFQKRYTDWDDPQGQKLCCNFQKAVLPSPITIIFCIVLIRKQ